MLPEQRQAYDTYLAQARSAAQEQGAKANKSTQLELPTSHSHTMSHTRLAL